MIVLDASAALALLLGGEGAERVATRVLDPAESLHAPHLLDLEVAQVVRRYWRAGDLSPARGGQVLDDLLALPIRRYAHEPFVARIWALRANATAYDAAYLALAEALRSPLLTRDARLAAVPGVRARVEVV